jgi:hypothetical protein
MWWMSQGLMLEETDTRIPVCEQYNSHRSELAHHTAQDVSQAFKVLDQKQQA